MNRKKRNSLTVGEAATKFLTWVASSRSVNTHRMYEGRLKPFIEEFGGDLVRKLKPKRIDKYFERVNKWLDGRDKANDTIRANITAVEQLQTHINKRLAIPCVLIRYAEKPIGRIRERMPTAEEVARIESVASPAFRLIYRALRRSGARPNELAMATVADWRQPENLIVLEKHKTARKTGRPRKIIVGTKFEEMIKESLGDRTEGPLFVTPSGRQWVTDTLSQSFARYRKEAGVDAAVKLYSARHSFATACYHAEFSLIDISLLMGHAGTMSQRYIHPADITRLREKQDSISV